MNHVARRVAVCAALFLPACDSENVSWAFVSNPGGSFGGGAGGGVIVIRTTGSSAASTAGVRWLRTPGVDADGPVTVHLAVGAEHAVLERPRELEFRAPLLDAGAVRLPGAVADFVESGPTVLRIRALDVAELDPRATGPGVLWAAAAGTLILVEHAAGVLALGDAGEQGFDAGSAVREIGDGLFVEAPDGRLTRIVPRPAPTLAERLRRPAAGRIELLGPRGDLIARLPEDRVRLHGGSAGLFLTASFPDGLDAPVPTVLTAAEGNRFLLRVDGP